MAAVVSSPVCPVVSTSTNVPAVDNECQTDTPCRSNKGSNPLLGQQGVIAGLTAERPPGLAGALMSPGAIPLSQGAQVLGGDCEHGSYGIALVRAERVRDEVASDLK
jgi:hypothetical protein